MMFAQFVSRVKLILLFGPLVLAGCSSSSPPPPPVDPRVALSEAIEALTSEAPLPPMTLQRVLELDPDDADLLLSQAQLARRLGRRLNGEGQQDEALPLFIKAAEAFRKAETANPKLTTQEKGLRGPIYYDAACALSLLGRTDESLANLRLCIDSGYDDVNLFAFDHDLDAVRATPQYAVFEQDALANMRKLLAAKLDTFESFPYKLELTDLKGQPISLEKLRGKVVVVDYWATWCGPCLQVIPDLCKIYEERHDQGLEVIGLSYEGEGVEDPAAVVTASVAQLKIPYPCALGDDATYSQVPQLESIPTMIFLDRSGRVRFRTTGQHSREYILALIEPLLAEKETSKHN